MKSVNFKSYIEPESRGNHFREHAPDTIALDIAENMLLADELADLVAHPPLHFVKSDLKYAHNSVGPEDVRSAIADLLSQTWALENGHRLSAENVLCTPGASAALHLHAKARLQPGDSIIIPRPYWQMFDRIYGQLGVHIEALPASTNTNTVIDLHQLKTLYKKLLTDGRRPRVLLITNPHNPLGVIESRQTLQSLLSWVLEFTDLEIVSDEIYAHSIFDSATSFTSVMAMDDALQYPERVHVVWGFAKDFGLSGWMAGVLLTRSNSLRDVITHQYARFSPFDALKGRVFRRLLCESGNDQMTPQQLLRLMAARLTTAREQVAEALQAQAISYRRDSQAAPFFWLDLRPYLDADLDHSPHAAVCILDGSESVDLDSREGKLQQYIACVAGVVLLRGQIMHSEAPGYFRLCFTAESTQTVIEAVQRIGRALREL